jgi:hypothetical protein
MTAHGHCCHNGMRRRQPLPLIQCAALLIGLVRFAGCSAQDQKMPTAFAAPEPEPILEWGAGDGRSFLVPALEIPSFQLLLNRYDHAQDADTYPWPVTNLRRNLPRSWVVDNDKISTNQFLHPYQGSVYQGFAVRRGWITGRRWMRRRSGRSDYHSIIDCNELLPMNRAMLHPWDR